MRKFVTIQYRNMLYHIFLKEIYIQDSLLVKNAQKIHENNVKYDEKTKNY